MINTYDWHHGRLQNMVAGKMVPHNPSSRCSPRVESANLPNGTDALKTLSVCFWTGLCRVGSQPASALFH